MYLLFELKEVRLKEIKYHVDKSLYEFYDCEEIFNFNEILLSYSIWNIWFLLVQVNYAFTLCWNKINLLLALLNLLNLLLSSENMVASNLTIFSRVDNIPNFRNWYRQEKDFRKSTFTNGILFEKHTNINYLYRRTKFKLIKEHDSDFACMRMRCTIANRISENWQYCFKEKIHRTKKHKVIRNFIYVKIAGKWYKFSI